MEEYKISKDKILEAHKAACGEWKAKIETWFPELFTIKTLKLGVWYKTTTGYLYYQGKKGVGLTNNRWFDIDSVGWTITYTTYNPNNPGWILREATAEEIKEILTTQATKRGFIQGVKISPTGINEPNDHIGKGISGKFDYYIDNDILDSSNGEGIIWEKGKWADIKPTAKKLSIGEIEKILGYEIEIINK